MSNLLEIIWSAASLIIIVLFGAMFIICFIIVSWIMWDDITNDSEEDDMEDIYKEVYFDQYCQFCKHEKLKEADDPCDDCLAQTVNLYSHKPVYWEEKEK